MQRSGGLKGMVEWLEERKKGRKEEEILPLVIIIGRGVTRSWRWRHCAITATIRQGEIGAYGTDCGRIQDG